MADKFHRAAKDGFLDILREGNRKEMNSTDVDGCTPAMLAAQQGNIEALRMIIMRGGDVDKMDLMGFTALHHAARNNHLNCVSFLITFGANIWILDNDNHTAMEIAAMENREDIVRILDDAQNVQLRKNPKVVQDLKEKAIRAADKNLKMYERLQEKASKELEKSRKIMEKEECVQNSEFKEPSSNSFVKKLTLRMKGNTAKKIKAANSTTAFSDLANGTTRGTVKNLIHRSEASENIYDFKVSEMDESGKRTLKSVKGTIPRKGAQVLYMTNIDINGTDKSTDSTTRPNLTSVFPGASVDGRSKSKMDSYLTDSGNGSLESGNAGDEIDNPGIFSRPMFGQIAFLSRFDHIAASEENDMQTLDDEKRNNGFNCEDAVTDDRQHIHNGAQGHDITGNSSDVAQDLPWKDEEVDDEYEEENEYTPVVMFLESCGLAHYSHLFLNGDVDMDALMILTNQDLNDMGLPIGPRRKIMDAIQHRKTMLNQPVQMHDSHL